MDDSKIWTHSGDSHFLEPADLWQQIMPKKQADRMPRTELIGDSEELVTVDGKSFRRHMGLTPGEYRSRAREGTVTPGLFSSPAMENAKTRRGRMTRRRTKARVTAHPFSHPFAFFA